AVIFAGTQGYLDGIPVARVTEYEAELLSFLRTQKADVLAEIRDTKDLGDSAKAKLKEALDAFAKQFA
ncbi:F0F1 ATP synthase subunit alpha, partial [Acinetobacter baumannii]